MEMVTDAGLIGKDRVISAHEVIWARLSAKLLLKYYCNKSLILRQILNIAALFDYLVLRDDCDRSALAQSIKLETRRT